MERLDYTLLCCRTRNVFYFAQATGPCRLPSVVESGTLGSRVRRFYTHIDLMANGGNQAPNSSLNITFGFLVAGLLPLPATRKWVHVCHSSYLYSTVTLFARLRGWSTSAPRRTAIS